MYTTYDHLINFNVRREDEELPIKTRSNNGLKEELNIDYTSRFVIRVREMS